jgi:zinc transport system permease protein
MDFFTSIMTYSFLQTALIAAVLSGVACGIVGTYIVSRRMVFLSGGITHASFGGIGIAYYLGLNPIGGAMIFAILSAIGVEWASAKGRIREDSAIGIVWSVGMAVGLLFIYLTPGYAANLMTYLFGDVLTVGENSVVALALLVVVLIAVSTLFGRPIVYSAFDREFSKSQGIKADLILAAMTVLTAITIVLSIRIVGIVLLISLLTIPPVIAASFTKSYMKIAVLSSILAVVGNVLGLYAAYKINLPVGVATIILLAMALFAVKLLTLPKLRSRRAKLHTSEAKK